MSSIPSTRRVRLSVAAALALAILWMSVGVAQQAPSSKASVSAAGKSAGAAAQSAAAKPNAALPITSADVLTHVRRSVAWYRDLGSVEQISLPGVDAVARSQLQRQGLTAVRLAFEFGKASEDILGREAEAQGASASSKRGTGGTPPSAAPTMAAQL